MDNVIPFAPEKPDADYETISDILRQAVNECANRGIRLDMMDVNWNGLTEYTLDWSGSDLNKVEK